MHLGLRAGLLLLVLPLTGCLKSTTLITVDRAGRGTIEQTLLSSPKAPTAAVAGFGASAATPPTDMAAMAAALGPGVRFVSQRPAQAGGFTGTTAIFAFDDIRTVRLRTDPNAPADAAPIAFAFVPQGDGRLLTVTLEQPNAAAAPGAAAPPALPVFGTPSAQVLPPAPPALGPNLADPAVVQMVKRTVDGFQMSVALQVQGTITGTSATQVTGSRVTLLDVDAATLLANPETPGRLQGVLRPGISLTELRPQLKGLTGVVLEGPSVTVAFK